MSVEGYDSIESSATVYQQGPPVILRESLAQHSYVSDTIELVCEVVSIPAPSIEWRYNNYIITSNIEHYTIITHTLDQDKVVSTLIIKNSVQSDFGDYNCSARNSYGHDTAIIHLVRQDFSMVLLLVVGLVLSALLVIITLLVFTHWRRVRQTNCVDHSKEKPWVGDARAGLDDKTRNKGWQTSEETEGNEKPWSKVNLE